MTAQRELFYDADGYLRRRNVGDTTPGKIISRLPEQKLVSDGLRQFSFSTRGFIDINADIAFMQTNTSLHSSTPGAVGRSETGGQNGGQRLWYRELTFIPLVFTPNATGDYFIRSSSNSYHRVWVGQDSSNMNVIIDSASTGTGYTPEVTLSLIANQDYIFYCSFNGISNARPTQDVIIRRGVEETNLGNPQFGGIRKGRLEWLQNL